MLRQVHSLSFQPLKAPGTVTVGEPLLSPKGPFAILGMQTEEFGGPISPSAASLFGPRGVCLHPNGSLWVSDTGHHRLLGWRSLPRSDNATADILIGQADFSKEGRNGRSQPGPATLNVPTGIAAWRGGLAVADPWNHRVLIWRDTPADCNQPADIVLGQADFVQALSNRGLQRPTAETLNWPYGIAEVDGKLAVADTGNRRVLVWNDPHTTGQPADLVLGQTSFGIRDENAGCDVGPRGMRWPHGIARWGRRFAVSDAGNNRVMIWSGLPQTNAAPCECVLGQTRFSACDHNGAYYYPSSATMNMPYAIAVHRSEALGERLIVADTANSRLIGFAETADTAGAHAEYLCGQPDFASKGDNRWGFPVRDSMCWPYGLSILGDILAIADSGNNRVLLWDIAP